jgi:hypothetical protein
MDLPRIACLAWGSLLWDPRTLPTAGAFHLDGPRLPIEFSRVASDGRVTLVIDVTADDVATYWVRLAVENVAEAIRALAFREKISAGYEARWIGVQMRHSDGESNGGDGELAIRRTIRNWLGQRNLDAVVWTALPSRQPNGELGHPTLAELLTHLESLEGAAYERAEEYIRRAPHRVRTRNRAEFEARLDWLPASEDGWAAIADTDQSRAARTLRGATRVGGI